MALLFVVVYGSLAPWWRSAIGRNMMAMGVAHLILFSLINASLVFGVTWVGRPIVRAFAYGVLAAIFAWRTAIFVREQVTARRLKRETQNVE
jgi:hypothetical protein